MVSIQSYNSTPLQLTDRYRFLPKMSASASYGFAVVFGLISIEIVIANILIITCVCKFVRLRSISTNKYFASLSVADLIIGTIVMPAAIYEVVSPGGWMLGKILCRVRYAVDVMASTASILHLCAIALDKFYHVRYPLRSRATQQKRVSCSLLFLWIIPISLSFPAIFYWEHVDKIKTNQIIVAQAVTSLNYTFGHTNQSMNMSIGTCEFTDDKLYIIGSSIVSFYIPLLVMIIAYFLLYRTASKHIKLLGGGRTVFKTPGSQMQISFRVHLGRYDKTKTNPLNKNNVHCQESNEAVSNESTENDRLQPATISHSFSARRLSTFVSDWATRKKPNIPITFFAKEAKVARTLGFVIFLFIACWCPFFIVNIMYAVCVECISSPETTYFIVTWLGYINSGVNPLIYVYTMPEYRKAMHHLLRRQHWSIEKRPRTYSEAALDNATYKSRANNNGDAHTFDTRNSMVLNSPSSCPVTTHTNKRMGRNHNSSHNLLVPVLHPDICVNFDSVVSTNV